MSSPQNPGPQGTPPSGPPPGDNPWNQPTVVGPPGQAVPGPGGGGWDQNYQGGPGYPPSGPAYGDQPPFSDGAPPFSGGAPPFSGTDPNAPGATGFGGAPYGTPPPPSGYGNAPGYGAPAYGGAAPPPPGQKSNKALWIVGGVIGAVVLLCLAGLLLFRTAGTTTTPTTASSRTTAVSPNPAATTAPATPTTKGGTPATTGAAATPATGGLAKTGANPQEISGNGPGDYTVKLNKGLILMETKTPNNLLFKVLDPATNSPIWSAFLANGASASDARYIEKAGEYKVSLSGDAGKPFKMTFSELPTTGGAPAPFAAKGDKGKHLLGPVELKGPIKMTGTHSGRGNFVIYAVNPTKNDEDLLYNEIGTVQALAKTAKPTGGSWYFKVQADGPWEFSIEPG